MKGIVWYNCLQQERHRLGDPERPFELIILWGWYTPQVFWGSATHSRPRITSVSRIATGTTTSKSPFNLKQELWGNAYSCLLFCLTTLWVATATDAQPVVATAASTVKFIGYPSPCCLGSCPHPCPGSSAKCCPVTRPCRKLPRVQHKHSESWKPCTKCAVNPEDCVRD